METVQRNFINEPSTNKRSLLIPTTILGDITEVLNYKTGELQFILPDINSNKKIMIPFRGVVTSKNNINIFGTGTTVNIFYSIIKLNASTINVIDYLGIELEYIKESREATEFIRKENGIESKIIIENGKYIITEGNIVTTFEKYDNNNLYKISKLQDKNTNDQSVIEYDDANNKIIIYNNYLDNIIIEKKNDMITKITNEKEDYEVRFVYGSNNLISRIFSYQLSNYDESTYKDEYLSDTKILWIKSDDNFYIKSIKDKFGREINYEYKNANADSLYKLYKKSVIDGLESYLTYNYFDDRIIVEDNFSNIKTMYFDINNNFSATKEDNLTVMNYNYFHFDDKNEILFAEPKSINNLSKNYLVNGDFYEKVDRYMRPKYFNFTNIDYIFDTVVNNNFGYTELIKGSLLRIGGVQSNTDPSKIKVINQIIKLEETYEEKLNIFSFWYHGSDTNDLEVLVNNKVIPHSVVSYKNGFNFITTAVTLKYNEKEIDLSIKYKGSETVYFGDLRLNKIGGPEYKINRLGQIAKTDEETIEYDDLGRVIKVSKDDEVLIYTYNLNGRLVNVRDEKSLFMIGYEYDNKNNITLTTVRDKDGIVKTNQTTYDPITELITSEKNNDDLETRYYYDKSMRLNSIIDPSGLSTNYKYNYLNELTETSFKLNNLEETNNFIYENDLIKNVKTNNNESFDYDYDNYKRLTKVRLNGYNLEERTYQTIINNQLTNLVSELKYDNNNVYSYNYNSKLKPIKIKYNNVLEAEFGYDDYGRITEINDIANNHIKEIKYEDVNIISQIISNNGRDRLTSNYTYDGLGRLRKRVNELNGINYNYTYNNKDIEDENKKTYMTLHKGESNSTNPSILIESFYDKEGRLSKYKRNTHYSIFENNYSYSSYNKTNTIIEKTGSINKIYTFDEIGNVTHIVRLNNNLFMDGIIYEYDEFKRLISESKYNSNNQLINNILYSYDSSGNIISKKINNKTMSYIYNGTIKNRLDKVVSNGEVLYEFSYNDNKFNPSSYKKGNINHNLIWKGRNLIQIGSSSYKYNESGIRIEKSENNIITNYILEGNKVISSKTSNDELVYHYDSNDMVIGFNYLDKEYFYERDLLGNIISIIDAYDVTVVKYEYTAFGIPTIIVPENLDGNYQALANKLKNLNIYLYKGYIYDIENKLYYCESRYYDPELGRWISIDSYNYLDPSSANGSNLYAYCVNNPVMYSDSTGNSPEWWHWVASGAMVVGGVALMFTPLGILGGALVTAGVSSMVGGYLSEQSGGSFTAGWVGGAVAGFVSGLGAGMASSLYYAATISAGGGTFYAMGSFAVAGTLGFLGNFGGSIITQSWDNKQIDFTQAFVSGTIGGILNVAFVPFSAGANVLSKLGYQTLSVGYSILVETISQVASYGIDQVINGSHNYRFNRLTRRFG